MLTYIQLKQKVAELTQHVKYNSSGTATYDSAFFAKAGTWLNFSQKHLANIYDFWIELQFIYNFDTGDGTEAYSMPADFDKPFRVYNLTSKSKVDPQTEEEYTDANLSSIVDATEGRPDKYRIYGVSTRLKQMKLGLIPDDTYSMRVLYKKLPTDMSADDSYPFVDADPYFVWDVCGYAWKWEREEEKAAFAWQKAQEAFVALMTNQGNKLGVNHVRKMSNVWAQAHRNRE